MKRGTYKVKHSTKQVDPRTILNYFSKLGHIKQTTAKKAIEAARDELTTTHTTWESQLSHESKKWPPVSEEKLEKMVAKALTKKYKERNSPMFSASDLCGSTMYGQHTKFNKTYKSVKRGKSCVWLFSK